MDTKIYTITGILKKVLYCNKENNFIIAVLTNGQKICGSYLQTDINNLIDEEVKLIGNWIEHKKYGIQFEFSTLEVNVNEFYFFLRKIVKGIGNQLAKEMCKKYSDEELVDIFNNNPKKLLQFKGIKEKKLENIINNWNKYKHLREIGTFLAKYNVSKTFINKIYLQYQDVPDIAKKIQENPYMLTAIRGIGFKKADMIAKEIGIDERSPFRIQSCINWVLKEHCDNIGNSSISKQALFELLNDALGLDDANKLFEAAIIDLLHNETIYETSKDRYATSLLYYCESKIIDFFKNRSRLSQQVIVKDFDTYITNKEKQLNLTLSQQQKEAVSIINQGYNTLFLIGYAGTGKSTSSKAILELLEEKYSYDDIICIALSGVAAQRIGETTNYRHSTLQSLLVKEKDKDYFDYKVILAR